MSSAIDLATYTFNDHRHNYAVWTASRAVQRGFTSTKLIAKDIEKSDLRKFVEDVSEYNAEDFKQFHIKCSNQLITAFKILGISGVTYGRAAKIIAIYLKTSVILPQNGRCNRCNIIHPPIDSILLTRMSEIVELREIRNLKWTMLHQSAYWDLENKLREHFKSFDWTLEVYWSAI